MTTPMALGMAPDGRVIAVGTEAKNEVRFESNLRSRFIRSEVAVLPAAGAVTSARADLNPHLNYTQPTIPPLQRMLSIGDPRGVAVSADGTRAYATGLGSSNIVSFSLANLARLGSCNVGDGPTGIVLDAAREYFNGASSTLDPALERMAECLRVLPQTTPAVEELCASYDIELIAAGS